MSGLWQSTFACCFMSTPQAEKAFSDCFKNNVTVESKFQNSKINEQTINMMKAEQITQVLIQRRSSRW